MKLIAGFMLLALLPLSGQAPQGLQLKFGTWKLNLQKSKFPPETSPPQSDTRIYEDGGAAIIRSTHTTVNHQGEESLTTYSAKFDGKEYPVVTRGSNAPASIAFHIIDPYSESFVLTRDGKVATRGTTTISKDGKTLTMTLNTINAKGQTSQGISIYDKQ
jgi:hypothetical protein